MPAVNARAPALYFPVELPPRMPGPFFEVGPTSAAGSMWIELDRERDDYLRAKHTVLRQPDRKPARQPGPLANAAIAAAERWLRSRMCQEHPDTFDAAALAQNDLDALSLQLQEDVVVLARAPGAAARQAPAVYLHVCLPSHWNPQRMLGKNFIGLHARVPYESGFTKVDRGALAETLFSQPRVRFVWALTPSADLDQHPDRTTGISWPTAETGYLRVERQSVIPLLTSAGGNADACLFLIRVYRYPFSRLTAEQLRTLRRAVDSMSPAMRRYKGLEGHETRVMSLLHEP